MQGYELRLKSMVDRAKQQTATLIETQTEASVYIIDVMYKKVRWADLSLSLSDVATA